MWKAICVLIAIGAGKIQGSRFPSYRRIFDPQAIVGGQAALENTIPYQVSLKGYGYENFCGGSLVKNGTDSVVVVTAAHCVPLGTDKNAITVVLGRHSLTTAISTEKRYDISKIVVHPEYTKATSGNDIAVLYLDGKVNLGNGISTIKLPEKGARNNFGSQCLISGWGTLSSGGSISPDLMKAEVDMFSNDKCYKSYKKKADNFEKTTMLCAGKEEGGIDSCQGDSGGPLACTDDNGEKVLTGVTSWGYGCASAQYPGIYSDVYKLRDWLDGELKLTETR